MNLLPESRKKALSRMYTVRLGVVGVLLLSGVLVIHSVLTVPTLVHQYLAIQESAAFVSALDKQLTGSGEQEVSARVRELNETGAELTRTAAAATASGAVRAVTQVPHPGVRITGFSFTRGVTDTERQMRIVGRATSREALRAYANALGTVPYIATVDLPISAYAKETDIDFAIVLTGSLML